MQPYRIYTRKIMGLDNRVWRLMFIMIVLPLGLLSYRLVYDDEKCTPFSFSIKTLSLRGNDIYYTGDVLSFTASIPSKGIDWDFGDNTSDAGENVHHQFMKEGKFLVQASGNSLCSYKKEITIQNPPVKGQPSDPFKGKIAGLTSFYSNRPQKFTYQGTAKSYEWTVQNHPVFGTESGQTVSFTFPFKGSYTIQVELDGDSQKRDFFDVSVLDEVKTALPKNSGVTIAPLGDGHPLPPPPLIDTAPVDTTAIKPSGPKFKIISPETFLTYLEKVQAKEMTMSQFELYGVYESTPVVANGKAGQKFGWLCSEILKKKKSGIPFFKRTLSVKLKSAMIQRINNVVSVVEVNYDYE